MVMDLSPDDFTDSLSRIRDGVFFVVGHHRGGTTLLQAMLASHPRLTLPPETGFFQQVWTRRSRFEPLTDPSRKAQLWAYLRSPECSVSDLELDWKTLEDLSSKQVTDCAEVFVLLLAEYARLRGKPRAGEKSPGHIHEIPLLAKLYPQAKFVCVLRDPRAVVRSEWETSWGSRSWGRIVARWNRVVDRHQQLLADPAISPRYLAIRYEDLVLSPTDCLQRVCAHLGEDFAPEMLQFQRRATADQGFAANEIWKHNTLAPLNPHRADAWKSALRRTEIDAIERCVEPRLALLHYAPHEQRSPGFVESAWETLCDRVRWGSEIAWALVRPRTRRRPLSVALREWWSRTR